MLEIRSEIAAVTITPELGASILRYGLNDGRQIFRPAIHPKDGFDCACYVLAPWCNRIDGGITGTDGRFRSVAPTHQRFPLPIHGSAALSEWEVVAQEEDRVALATTSDWPEPFHYRAEIAYALDYADLSIELSLTHLGEATLPYGLGIHPWFRRTPITMLRAAATTWQKTDERLIPVKDVPVGEKHEWDFSMLRGLPADLIDTAFGGWDGNATLLIDHGLSLRISTDPALRHYQIYSTGKDADFVCFEPVTHPVNAHNMPGFPGLGILNRDDRMTIRIAISPVVN